MTNFKKLSAYTDVPCEWVSAAAPRNDKLDQLKAENAKLRELVRDIYEMAYPEYPSAFDAAFSDRMRELGVEGNQ